MFRCSCINEKPNSEAGRRGNSKGSCDSIFLKGTQAESQVPLDPHRAIIRGLLLLSSSRRQALPARSLMTDSSFRMRAWK